MLSQSQLVTSDSVIGRSLQHDLGLLVQHQNTSPNSRDSDTELKSTTVPILKRQSHTLWKHYSHLQPTPPIPLKLLQDSELFSWLRACAHLPKPFRITLGLPCARARARGFFATTAYSGPEPTPKARSPETRTPQWPSPGLRGRHLAEGPDASMKIGIKA